MSIYDDFINGLTVLRKYETYGAMAKEFGGYYILAGETAPDDMTPEDRAVMELSNWVWDAGQEAWAHYID